MWGYLSGNPGDSIIPEELVKLRKQNSDPGRKQKKKRRGYLEKNRQLLISDGEAGKSNRSHADITSDLQRVFMRVVYHQQQAGKYSSSILYDYQKNREEVEEGRERGGEEVRKREERREKRGEDRNA